MKACVIGLDCLEPSLVERWIGDLPTFARLRAAGAWGRMRSCIPPITVPAWSCMMSSQDPGSLGIYGFRNRVDFSYTGGGFATSDWVKAPRIWDLISAAGRTCSVLGVPGTYPVRQVKGQMVSCFLTPSLRSEWTFPSELKNEINSWLNGEEYLFDVVGFRTSDKARILADIKTMTRRRFTVAREMLRRFAPDFFMMVEMGSDRIHHALWHYMDTGHRKYEPGPLSNAIHDYYVQLDGEIDRLLQNVDMEETTVLIVSDHGAKRLDGGVCINEWLRKEGYLVLKKEPEAAPVPLRECEVDWEKTRAWGDGGYYARVWLNVEGREPQGVVKRADYEKVRDELATKLRAIPDDRGQPMRTKALKPQDIYHQIRGIPPDLLVIFGDLNWRAVGTLGYNGIYTYENDTGPDEANHAQYGYFNWAGPGVSPQRKSIELDILDIAPTMLSMLKVPIPAQVQGRVRSFAEERAS